MKSSEIDIGVIRNDSSLSDAELLERMHAIEEKREELAKKRKREELRRDPDATIKAYRAAHFICSPRCGFVCDRRDEASIIAHQSQCGWCIQSREQKAEEMKFIQDGNVKMRYILHMIESCKTQVENHKRKIQREKNEKQPNWELMIKQAERRILELENNIHKEQVEKLKLLRHENEIVAKSAKELYIKYLMLTPEQRSRCQY